MFELQNSFFLPKEKYAHETSQNAPHEIEIEEHDLLSGNT